MHDHVPVVEEYPAGRRCAFATQRAHPVGLNRIVHGFNHRLQLPYHTPRGDDEEVGERGDAAYIQQQDILRLLIRKRVYYLARELVALQSYFLLPASYFLLVGGSL